MLNQWLKSPFADAHEFQPILVEIEERPVSPLGRMTFWTLLALLLVAALWLYFGQVDVVVSASGRLIPQGHAQIIQPFEEGVISAIKVKEGELVKKGQVLVTIDPSIVEPTLISLQQDLQLTTLEMDRIQAALSGRPFNPDPSQYPPEQIATQQYLYTADRNRLSGRITAKEQELAQAQAQLAAAETALQQSQDRLALDRAQQARYNQVKDIIPRKQLEDVQAAIVDHTSQFNTAQHHMDELAHKQAQINREMTAIESDVRNGLLTELADKQKRMIELKARLEQTQFKTSRQTLRAPVDGYIDELSIHTVGGVVSPAEKLVALIPSKAPLVVEALVENRDIGQLRSGQQVAVKVDTYDFQKYGALPGTVIHIAPDSHGAPAPASSSSTKPPTSSAVSMYKVLVRLNQNQLKTKQFKIKGRPAPLKAGMTVKAEIKVGHRRIIEFFVYPLFRSLEESVSVR